MPSDEDDGPTKDEMEESAEGWDTLAHRNGYVCADCHQIISYEERKVYFASGKCAMCKVRRDD